MQRLKQRFSKPKQQKPLPFTDQAIRERAYGLWQTNPEQSADEHWQGAIELLKRERSPLWRVRQTLWLPFRLLGQGLRFLWRLPGNVVRVVRLASTTETPGAALDLVKVVISGFGVLATIFAGVGLYLTYSTGQAQLEAAQQERQLNSERLVTDRFAKAVEQLGNGTIDVRIGAIYSLERIAKDSPKDHWTIMEVLVAFVRNKSPLPKDWKPDSKQQLTDVTTDVQSVLTVMGRRDVRHDQGGESLNLEITNLSGADLIRSKLSGANLVGAILDGAHLFSADLSGADLSGAFLFRADLRSAHLSSADLFVADLSGADLSNANLSFAELSHAKLTNARLNNANFSGAFLFRADLSGADLTGTNLQQTEGITTRQIKTAKNWQNALYSPNFRKQLGLPPQKAQP